MKTYSETQGNKKFDWFKELSNKNISDKKWDALTELSDSWVTCACGNSCHVIPRRLNGAPSDENLRALGIEFNDRIEAHERTQAISTLKKIEKRSSYLIGIEYKKAMALAKELKSAL